MRAVIVAVATSMTNTCLRPARRPDLLVTGPERERVHLGVGDDVAGDGARLGDGDDHARVRVGPWRRALHGDRRGGRGCIVAGSSSLENATAYGATRPVGVRSSIMRS